MGNGNMRYIVCQVGNGNMRFRDRNYVLITTQNF